jgi:hypothetical protein
MLDSFFPPTLSEKALEHWDLTWADKSDAEIEELMLTWMRQLLDYRKQKTRN